MDFQVFARSNAGADGETKRCLGGGSAEIGAQAFELEGIRERLDTLSRTSNHGVALLCKTVRRFSVAASNSI